MASKNNRQSRVVINPNDPRNPETVRATALVVTQHQLHKRYQELRELSALIRRYKLALLLRVVGESSSQMHLQHVLKKTLSAPVNDKDVHALYAAFKQQALHLALQFHEGYLSNPQNITKINEFISSGAYFDMLTRYHSVQGNDQALEMVSQIRTDRMVTTRINSDSQLDPNAFLDFVEAHLPSKKFFRGYMSDLHYSENLLQAPMHTMLQYSVAFLADRHGYFQKYTLNSEDVFSTLNVFAPKPVQEHLLSTLGINSHYQTYDNLLSVPMSRNRHIMYPAPSYSGRSVSRGVEEDFGVNYYQPASSNSGPGR